MNALNALNCTLNVKMVNIVVYISPHFFLNPVAKKQTLEPLTYNFLLSEIIKYIPFYVKKKSERRKQVGRTA